MFFLESANAAGVKTSITELVVGLVDQILLSVHTAAAHSIDLAMKCCRVILVRREQHIPASTHLAMVDVLTRSSGSIDGQRPREKTANVCDTRRSIEAFHFFFYA